MKSKQGAVNAPHKHLHSRLSYLYQAATHLAVARSKGTQAANLQETDTNDQKSSSEGLSGRTTGESVQSSKLSRQMLSQLRGVSLKAQIRLAPSVKHSICKCCDTLLVPGSTSTSYVENKSRGGKKPWADVLVAQCTYCGAVRRFPVGVKRQLGKNKRSNRTEENITPEGG